KRLLLLTAVFAGAAGAAGGGGASGKAAGDPGAATGGIAAPRATVRQLANPVKFSRTPASYAFAGVKTGTHNREVLKALGYTEAQIAEFAATGLFD
ncbi:MAG TPA: hypothetical protein PLF52_10850, partial [Syntrophales bacterium]|nr:hypothetical protein [Syntrophales bacterium]